MKIEVKVTIDDYTRTLTNFGLAEFMKNNPELMKNCIRAVEKKKVEAEKPKRGRPKKKCHT